VIQSAAVVAFAAGGSACRPSIFGIGAEPGHQPHRKPSTRVPTEASGWRSTVRRSIARLVPQPGLWTSRHGRPATAKAVCELVKSYASRIGLKPADFGAHSLRAGFRPLACSGTDNSAETPFGPARACSFLEGGGVLAWDSAQSR
jgi:hypothetical protein